MVFYHLEEHTSGRHLLQVLEEDDFAREVIAPPKGIKKSSFFEAINSRGHEQLTYVFQQLQAKAAKILPEEHAELGNLVAIDGSLIDAVLSMHWADYRNDCRKAKVHLGFDINQGRLPYLLKQKKPYCKNVYGKTSSAVRLSLPIRFPCM